MRLATVAMASALLGGACAPSGAETAAEADETDSSEDALSYAPCHTALAEVDGVWAYSNGSCTAQLCSCGGQASSGALLYQCVEYAQRYFQERFGTPALWPVNYASQMCDAGRHPAGTTVHWLGDGYTPRRGDLAVWRNSTAGHVAVIADAWDGGIAIVEQNSSAEGHRVLSGDAFGGYYGSWGTTPACFVTAGGSDGGGDAVPPPPADGAASCDDLGYEGTCVASVALWSEGGSCRVRDCAGEGKTCGYIADGVGWGCLEGTDGSTAFDCATVGYEGVCLGATLVWAEGGACEAYDCAAAGKGCGWDEVDGWDCL